MTIPTPNEEAAADPYELLGARFDAIAKYYDAAYGPPSETGQGSRLMGWLREQQLAVLREVFPVAAHLLDIGSGTGEEALAMVQAGYSVIGIDISPAMVRQAQTKAIVNDIRLGIKFQALPAGRVGELELREPLHRAYSRLGTLNTEPNLAGVAQGLAGFLNAGAAFVATVMSRHCLFEIVRNLRRFKPGDTLARNTEWGEGRAGASGMSAPVKFYQPGEFAAAFAPYFAVESVRAFPLWLPPVHLQDLYTPEQFQRRARLDARMSGWRGFRAWGDHFLMVLRRTAEPVHTG